MKKREKFSLVILRIISKNLKMYSNNQINKFLESARIVGQKSKITHFRMGAILVRGKKIVSSGYNRFTGETDKIARKYNIENLWSLHAEMDAIIHCQGNYKELTVFVSGTKKNGRPMYCRPCNKCLKIIRACGIKNVYYSTKNGWESIHFEE